MNAIDAFVERLKSVGKSGVRRAVFLIAVISTLSLVAAGCGSSDDKSDTSSGTEVEYPTGKEMPTEPVTLDMWWWGEQEAKGATDWLNDTIEGYSKEHPNITIKPTLQTTEGLVPAFRTAAEAGKGPDIQYFWGGIWSLENAFDDYIRPVSDYIPEEELQHYINYDESSFDGKNWAAPWYVQPSFPVLYRNSVFEDAGVEIPEDFDGLLETCKVMNEKGVIPMALGVKDGFLGGWLYSMLGVQNVTLKDVVGATGGDGSFSEPPNSEWWAELQKMRDAKCFNDDINSLELYRGQDRWINGDAAMTIIAGSDIRRFEDEAGADDITPGAMPAWGDGEYAGKLGSTSQTVGITKTTEYPQVAADFIQYMHTPERMNAWFEATGAIPADDRFDSALIKSKAQKSVYDMVLDGAPYLENFIPTQLDSDGVFKNVQLMLSGDVDADAAAADMEQLSKRIRTTDPGLAENFSEWAQTLP